MEKKYKLKQMVKTLHTKKYTLNELNDLNIEKLRSLNEEREEKNLITHKGTPEVVFRTKEGGIAKYEKDKFVLADERELLLDILQRNENEQLIVISQTEEGYL